jgi:hypothetical protein
MELALLRSFLALAGQRHFGRTARLLNVSQPALTKKDSAIGIGKSGDNFFVAVACRAGTRGVRVHPISDKEALWTVARLSTSLTSRTCRSTASGLLASTTPRATTSPTSTRTVRWPSSSAAATGNRAMRMLGSKWRTPDFKKDFSALN